MPVGAWLRLMGERAGLYDESVGLSILVTLEALVLVAIGAWTTANVRRLVEQRRQAELDLVRLGSAVSTPLIETAPIGLAVLDRELRYLYVNPALASIDGLGALAHLGQRVDRVSPELGLDTAAALEGVLVSGQGIQDLEVSGHAAAGGEPGTWLLSAKPLTRRHGRGGRPGSERCRDHRAQAPRGSPGGAVRVAQAGAGHQRIRSHSASGRPTSTAGCATSASPS